MRLKFIAFVALAITNGSSNLGLEGFKNLPKCNGGISKEQSKFVIEEKKNCRWQVPKKLIEGRKIKLYEMKTECVDNEDQLFMLDGDEILGPFCQLEYSSRYKRGTSQDSAAHEVDVSLLNQAEGTEIIYISAPGGYKFRFKFNFEWELISAPEEAQFNLPSQGDCGPQHFGPFLLSAFSDRLPDTESPENALEGVTEFSASMSGFSNYFDSHFSEYCSALATRVPCQFFNNSESNELTAQMIFAKLEALVRFIISNCDDGFGHNWEAKLDQLKSQIGGEMPEIDPFSLNIIGGRPSLCDVCESDLDCGSFGEFFMTCSEETNRCVCADQWIDSNKNPHDGCESFRGEATKDPFQCETSNTSIQPQRTTTTTSTTSTTTTTSTRTTYESSETTARTEIVQANHVHEIINVSSKCPSNWLVTPMLADQSPWRSSLHAPENMCLFANLPTCSEPLFEHVLESHHCHNDRLLELFKSIVRQVAQVSVSGDFDRTCLYSIHEAPCHLLDFKEIRTTRNFVYQLVYVVKSWAIEKCGKMQLKSFLMPEILELITIVDGAAENVCPSLPIISSVNVQEFENMDFSNKPETIEQVQPIHHATPKPIADRFTTLKDGLCAAKSFGRLAPVVFKARAFAIRNPEIAFARFKTFAEEVGKVGKKTATLERKRRTCDYSIAGKMPCELLNFPTTEKACQLAQRAQSLFEHMKERCDEDWNLFFGNMMKELIEASENLDGSACSAQTDVSALVSETRKLSKQFEKVHGYRFKEALAEAKAQLKSEREEARKFRLTKKEAKNNARIEKLRKLASSKLEAAMLEVNKKQEKLEALKIAVAAAEVGNYALLERRRNSDRIEENEENEEMLLDVFYDYESEENEAESECALPDNLSFGAAEQRFETITDAYSGSSEIFSYGIITRVKRRFHATLEYIKDSLGNCSKQAVQVSCKDLDLIFNSTDIKSVIKAAANIVTVMERECAKSSFPEFYMTIRGRASKLIL